MTDVLAPVWAADHGGVTGIGRVDAALVEHGSLGGALNYWRGLLPPGEFAELVEVLEGLASRFRPQPHQLPPAGDWYVWMFEGGRGTGKTDAASHVVDRHMSGPACDVRVAGGHRMKLLVPKLADGVDSWWESPAGIRAKNRSVVKTSIEGSTVFKWPNGAVMRITGGDKPDSPETFRAGGNVCGIVVEEPASVRYLRECIEIGELGLRLGPDPRIIVAGTPKRTRQYRWLRGDLLEPDDRPVPALTKATIHDNAFLDPDFRRRMVDLYGGTELGRQELDGELIDEVKGALWRQSTIDENRRQPESMFAANPRGFDAVVVAMDPAVDAEGQGDECGLIVGARGADDGHVYVLDDLSFQGDTDEQADEAIAVWGGEFYGLRPEYILGEVNNGGGWIRTAINRTPGAAHVPVRMVHAAKSKVMRARPVQFLYQRGWVHHVGPPLPALEEQLTTWLPEDDSPDRMDALVWLVTHLLPDLVGSVAKAQGDQFRTRRDGEERVSGLVAADAEAGPEFRRGRSGDAGSVRRRRGGRGRV